LARRESGVAIAAMAFEATEIFVLAVLGAGLAVGLVVTGMCLAAARADREPRD
jgi:hypothetical protein